MEGAKAEAKAPAVKKKVKKAEDGETKTGKKSKPRSKPKAKVRAGCWKFRHRQTSAASMCLCVSIICDSWAVQEVASLNQPALHCLRVVQVVEAEGDGAVTAAEDATAANDSPASPPKKKARAPRKKKDKEQAAPAKVHFDVLGTACLHTMGW